MTASVLKDMRWQGFHRFERMVDGRPASIVLPKTPLPGNPWIWRTEFFGAFAWVDIALLGSGYHLAYIDVQDMYGAPRALDHMDVLYDSVRSEFGLSPHPVLEGFSRGGLFALNWARRHPSRVRCLYLDAPVCDFRSWPGGKGRAPGSAPDWEKLKAVYGLTEAEALVYNDGPLEDLDRLVRAGISIVAVYGARDEDLPPEENVLMLADRYRRLGGDLWLLEKAETGHHPHSLPEPAEIVARIRHANERDAVAASG